MGQGSGTAWYWDLGERKGEMWLSGRELRTRGCRELQRPGETGGANIPQTKKEKEEQRKWRENRQAKQVRQSQDAREGWGPGAAPAPGDETAG